MGEKDLKNEFLPKRIQKEKNFVSVCRKEENVLDSRGRRIGRRSGMRIEHVAMYVNDLEGARDFFVKYFEATCGEEYHNETTDFRSYFLSFSDGARLEIMNHPQVEDVGKPLRRTGLIHVAFSVGSKEKVDALTMRLKQDGYEVVSGPRTTGDGYYESCIVAVEGNQIEITV